MHTSGTIYADGRVVLHGFTPEKTRLLAINSHFIVIHHPGGCWWDNGGKHYGAASIDVKALASLRPGNEPGSWHFECKPTGPGISFHPTPKAAVREAVDTLERGAVSIGEWIAKRNIAGAK